jgi:hypothetical protein
MRIRMIACFCIGVLAMLGVAVVFVESNVDRAPWR